MHENRRLGIQRLHILQLFGLELFVNDARAIPEQHVRTGFTLHIATEMLVRSPDDLLAVVHEALDDFQRATGSHHPVGTCLDRSGGVGIDHHGALGVLIAKSRELRNGAAKIQRTGGIERWHQHTLFGIEDLGRLTHELHAGDHYRLRRMLIAETRHFQRVRYATTGFLGQRLDHRIGVVMRHEHCILLLQLSGNLATQLRLLLGRQGRGLLGGQMSLHKDAFGYLRHVRWFLQAHQGASSAEKTAC